MGAGVDWVQQTLRRARALLPPASPGSERAAAAARGADEPSAVRHCAALPAGRFPGRGTQGPDKAGRRRGGAGGGAFSQESGPRRGGGRGLPAQEGNAHPAVRNQPGGAGPELSGKVLQGGG